MPIGLHKTSVEFGIRVTGVRTLPSAEPILFETEYILICPMQLPIVLLLDCTWDPYIVPTFSYTGREKLEHTPLISLLWNWMVLRRDSSSPSVLRRYMLVGGSALPRLLIEVLPVGSARNSIVLPEKAPLL